ncbi:hypothetical protein, partial [Candidatus Accumulibacter vicinus]|uniref:hypothetical protein n=1 Tax=Candidatus Accumulibacter vicinus TaxID=2954382 RepID=UPI00235B6E71
HSPDRELLENKFTVPPGFSSASCETRSPITPNTRKTLIVGRFAGIRHKRSLQAASAALFYHAIR